ncbi:MAG: hypothetical protein M3P08_03565 [Thermoproteota archaeon]|nr:hypothetical protein [Thermoproteota archaeon]
MDPNITAVNAAPDTRTVAMLMRVINLGFTCLYMLGDTLTLLLLDGLQNICIISGVLS